MSIRIKNCGITTPDALEAAVESGVDFVGFIFHKTSPRYITPRHAAELAATLPGHVDAVAVVVDADDATLHEIMDHLQPRYLQLHGHETLLRVKEIAQHWGIEVIKAIPVRTAADLKPVASYETAADYLMFDAKSDKAPGGTGERFDWALLAALDLQKPWFLSGGLNADNVVEALDSTGALMLDVSSGLESAPGVKDPEKIRRFNQIVRDYEKQRQA